MMNVVQYVFNGFSQLLLHIIGVCSLTGVQWFLSAPRYTALVDVL